MANPDKSGDEATRRRLAAGIIAGSIAGIVVISGIAIGLAGGSRAETSRLVFSSVLPLLGTWVGTVLAFYFARENLQAATESTLRLAGRAEEAKLVADSMIREADFIAYDLGTSEEPGAVRLSVLHAKMREITPPSRRLPIRNATGAVLYVLHDSTLTAYAESVAETTTTLTRTLGDLVESADFRALVTAVGYVPEKATIADARTVMSSIENCNDVFVTATGKRDERAIGWLTNTLLAGVQ
jgi:hypothetical protein